MELIEDKEKSNATLIYQEFQNTYDLLKKEGFIERYINNEKAYNGIFWNVTEENKENVKTIPKPVINLCSLKVDNIVSNIISTPVSLRFNCADDECSTEFMTNFIKSLQKEMKHDRFRELYAKKSAILGTAVCHIVFNDKKFGTLGNYEGAIEEEYIPFYKVMCSNPHCLDEQKMKWWIIESRKSVGALRELCNDEKQKKLIVPDDKQENDPEEVDVNALCTCYLKYFRIDGEVYHTMVTKTAVVYEPTPLNPNLHKVKLKEIDPEKNTLNDILYGDIEDLFEIDEEKITVPDDTLSEGNTNSFKAKFYLYPIKLIVLKESDNLIYGMPITQDLINTNKCVNQLYSSSVTNANYNANDIIVVRKGALQGQKITNKYNQIIVDNSPDGNGIKRLGGINVMGNGVTTLADNIIANARTTGQFNETFTGDDSKDLSGVAIAQRQAQAEKPIDSMRKKLWYAEEDIGKILEMYVKFYFSHKQFVYEMDEAQIIKNSNFNNANAEQIKSGEVKPKSTSRFQTKEFNGEDYINVPFFVTVEAVQGTKDSDIMLMSVIQSLFLNGSWANMDVHAKRFFIEMYPLPNKQKFLALLEQAEKDYIAQLEQVNQQLTANNQQLQLSLKRAEAGVKYQSQVIASLEESYKKEVKAHQDDNKSRDDAMAQILSGNKQPIQDSTGMVSTK